MANYSFIENVNKIANNINILLRSEEFLDVLGEDKDIFIRLNSNILSIQNVGLNIDSIVSINNALEHIVALASSKEELLKIPLNLPSLLEIANSLNSILKSKEYVDIVMQHVVMAKTSADVAKTQAHRVAQKAIEVEANAKSVSLLKDIGFGSFYLDVHNRLVVAWTDGQIQNITQDASHRLVVSYT